MAQKYINNGQSTLSAGIATGDTTLFIQPAHGSRFPTVAGSDYAYVTLENASGNLEIVKVTAHTAAATSMTIVRAQLGTTARAWVSGDLVELRLTSSELDRFERAALRDGDTYTGTHDLTGAVVSVAAPTTGSNPITKTYFDSSIAGLGAASMWVSGTAYAYGVTTWSPLNGRTYRRIIAGAGIVDPKNDSTNWTPTSTSLPDQAGHATHVLTSDGTNGNESWQATASPDTSQTLADASTINWNMALGSIGTVTLNANRTFAAPSNLTVKTYILVVKQDATGSRSMIWNAIFQWPAGVPPTLSTAANAKDVFSFFFDGTNLIGSYLRGVA